MADSATQTFPFDSSVTRLRYFLGQVLTQRDLQLEQGYHLVLQRLMQREAFGTGTVVGLEVRSTTADGGTVSESVLVEPGLAYDPEGRELILEREVAIEVADVALLSEPTTFGSIDTMAALAAAVADRFLGTSLETFDTAELTQLASNLVTVGLFSTSPSAVQLRDALAQIPVPPTGELPAVRPPQLLREWLFDQLIGSTYVGLSYRESATDPIPANLDASCCGERVCFASRVQQGVTIVASRTTLPTPRDPFVDFKISLDADLLAQIQAAPTATQLDCRRALCSALVQGRPAAAPWNGIPVVAPTCAEESYPIVPLARVSWRRYAIADVAAPQILSIDNCTYRSLAPGMPALRALVAALTGCSAPTLLAPRIIAISPTDGAAIPIASTGDVTDRLVLIAHCNAKLSATNLARLWQIIHYPAAGSGSTVTYPSSASTSNGPGNTTVSVTFENLTGSGGTNIRIAFGGGSEFPIGTYVWRLLNDATSSSAIVAEGTTRQLDGEPHPVGAVPSGNGIPGGAFEARFHVRA